MADEYVDNFAEDVDGDLEVIQEQPEETENQLGENQADKDEDETKIVVKAKKRVIRPQVKLDATRLVGARGIGILESSFKDFKLKGKGHELEDLNKTMRALEHWAHRLYPKMSFDDCIDKIEDLGFKKNVLVHVTKIRLGMEDDTRTTPDEVEEPVEEPVEADPFDALMGSVPAPSNPPALSEEQKARIMRNRLIAEEIRMKKMKERQEALKAQEVEASMQKLNSIVDDNDTPPESIEIS